MMAQGTVEQALTNVLFSVARYRNSIGYALDMECEVDSPLHSKVLAYIVQAGMQNNETENASTILHRAIDQARKDRV